MAVTSTITLPAQPGAGSSRLVVLAGDGRISPKSMYEVQVQLAGDVSGGLSTITVNFDPRYECWIKRMELSVLAAAANETYQMTQRVAGSGFNSTISGQTFRNAVSGFTPGAAWWDPPFLLPIDQATCIIANTDGDTHVLTLWIANFNVNASHTVRLGVINDSIRGGSNQSVVQLAP